MCFLRGSNSDGEQSYGGAIIGVEDSSPSTPVLYYCTFHLFDPHSSRLSDHADTTL
jgi:hypothetical protein